MCCRTECNSFSQQLDRLVEIAQRDSMMVSGTERISKSAERGGTVWMARRTKGDNLLPQSDYLVEVGQIVCPVRASIEGVGKAAQQHGPVWEALWTESKSHDIQPNR